MQDFLINEIKDYIENEINYIENNITCYSGNTRELARDINYLENINDEEIENIANKIIGNGFIEYLDELIHNEIYN